MTKTSLGMSERQLVGVLDSPGERLDRALALALPDLSRAQIQRLLKAGQVRVDGQIFKASQRLGGGEHYEIFLPEEKPADLQAESFELDIIYEDADLILLNKPAGMVVHPSAGHESGTLINAVLAHCPDLPGIAGEKRPGVVHRLDKDTSGLILVAKNDKALHFLQSQFQERTIEKTYLALVEGHISLSEFRIEAPIGRDPKQRKRMAVISAESSAQSREALTEIRLLSIYGSHSLVECRPLTGRTHQIRVHLAFAGHPIIGDKVYGRRKQMNELDRHFLHAAGLGFKRPSDGKKLDFNIPLPPELQSLLDSLQTGIGS
jgi:23S rRNA pseudouridine1911/1915/1917 synthase